MSIKNIRKKLTEKIPGTYLSFDQKIKIDKILDETGGSCSVLIRQLLIDYIKENEKKYGEIDIKEELVSYLINQNPGDLFEVGNGLDDSDVEIKEKLLKLDHSSLLELKELKDYLNSMTEKELLKIVENTKV